MQLLPLAAADGGAWSQLAPVERGRLLRKLSDSLLAHRDEHSTS